MPMGPKERRSTVLSPMEEVAIVALRVQARLPLDDVFIALKDVIPHLPSRNSGNQSPRSLTSSLTITRWDQHLGLFVDRSNSHSCRRSRYSAAFCRPSRRASRKLSMPPLMAIRAFSTLGRA